jgi:hypothetical protein
LSTHLVAICRATLERNRREEERNGRRYRYTAPSSRRYRGSGTGDSCFGAIAWRRFDPARARAELETPLAAKPDGFIGHPIFWGDRVSRSAASSTT